MRRARGFDLGVTWQVMCHRDFRGYAGRNGPWCYRWQCPLRVAKETHFPV